MNDKNLPFSLNDIKRIAEKYPTPFVIYDERGITQNVKALYDAFSWVKGEDGEGFKDYFAVKATPNPTIINLLKEQGL
jgi:diaminopimelate decarboxylase